MALSPPPRPPPGRAVLITWPVGVLPWTLKQLLVPLMRTSWHEDHTKGNFRLVAVCCLRKLQRVELEKRKIFENVGFKMSEFGSMGNAKQWLQTGTWTKMTSVVGTLSKFTGFHHSIRSIEPKNLASDRFKQCNRAKWGLLDDWIILKHSRGMSSSQ